MPRWYAMCKGDERVHAACLLCRRFVGNDPASANDPQQGWRTPELIGTHCNSFIERPAHAQAAITPTDSR